MRIAIFIILLICYSALPLLSQNKAEEAAKIRESRSLFVRVQNGLYGIGDSAHFWLDDSPKADTIFHIGDRFFGVREHNRRYRMVDAGFRSLSSDLDELLEFRSVIFMKSREGWKIFSKAEGRTETAYDSIRITGNDVLLYRKGKQGLLITSQRGQILIPPDYDRAGHYYDGVLLIDHGKLGWQGPFSIPVAYDHIYQERADIMAAQNASGTIYYAYQTGKPLDAQPTDSVVFYDAYYKRVRGRTQSIFRIQDNSLIAEIEGEQLHPFDFHERYTGSGYSVIGRDSVCALYRGGKILTDFVYQNFLPGSSIRPPYFRVLQKNGVGVIYETGEIQLASQYTDVLQQQGRYYAVRRGSRLGLVTRGDSLVLPFEYQHIAFCNNRYLYLSKDGRLFGAFDYVARREVCPFKYQNIVLNDNFILAQQEATSDIYLDGRLVMSDVYDGEINQNTAKGYKNGKIYIGSLRNANWEVYEYEIPSYQIRKLKEESRYYLRSDRLTDQEDLFDYASGKWGVFGYNAGSWIQAPLAHGGNNPHGIRLLDFPQESDVSWQGLNFRVIKKIAPIEIAWNQNAACNWIDVNRHSYSSQGDRQTAYPVSPICYREPGNGTCLANLTALRINAGFPGDGSKSILAEGGIAKIGAYGHIGLSAFITQLSASGNVRPASLADYSMLTDPRLYVSFSGASDHILHPSNLNTHISPYTKFEWVDPAHLNPAIVRVAGKYGLLSDTGNFLLEPEYESLAPLSEGNTIYLAGVRSKSYSIYDPDTRTTSRAITELLSFNNTHLLVKTDSLNVAVLNLRLDTLIVSKSPIKLLGDSSYVLRNEGLSTIYKNRHRLFTHRSEHTETINEGHYLIYDSRGYYVMSSRGDTIYRSRQAVRWIELGNNYLLDDGRQRTVFDSQNQVILRFDREPYLVTQKKQLIIKEKESTILLERNSNRLVRVNGRYSRASGKYVITRNDKYRQVYDYAGTMLVAKAAKVKAVSERYFSYQQRKKYVLYDVLTGQKKTLEGLNVNLSREGLEYDDEEIDADDSTELRESPEERYAIVCYHGKYGLKQDKDLLLPYRYFHIQRTGGVFLLQDKIDYKLFDLYSKRFLMEEAYENVYPYKSYFQVWKRGIPFYINP